MPGVCAIVFDDQQQVLLNRRADTGRWAVIGGLLEPGEEPAAGAMREVLEETGVRIQPLRISGIYATPVLTYANADRAQYIVTTFACRAIEGTPRVCDDESLEVAYFPLDRLPELSPHHRLRIEHAMKDGPAWFVVP